MTPFYTMSSAYNGQFFKLNIYSKKIDDLIGPFNCETGEENKYIVLDTDVNGKETRLYYENVNTKNCTEISVPVKKLNKHKFIDAVKSQLLYLPNVKFYVIDELGYKREESFQAHVLYNSENLIISNNSRYSRPHLVVVKDKSSNVGICYNEINYKELELDQRYGQVGLKVQMRAVGKDVNGEEYLINDGVTVTPNREQVIWNDDTKEYLLSITRKVTEEASEIINKELVEKDFLKWITKASTVLSTIQRDSPLYELSQMIDKSNITPTFTLDKSIKFKSPGDMFWGMYPRNISYRDTWVKATGSYVKKVERAVIEQWSQFSNLQVYFKVEEKTSNIKDQYILQTQLDENSWGYKQFVLLELDDLDTRLDDTLSKTDPAKKEEVENKFNAKREKMFKILEFMKQSSLFKSYDDLVVPDDFTVKAEEEEAKVAIIEAKETASLDELRKANGEIVFFTPRTSSNGYCYDEGLIWDKKEEKITTVASWNSNTYYGFNEDSEMLQCACKVLGREQLDWFNRKIKIVKVARKNEKHFKTIGEHISNFFYRLSDNCITMNPEVQNYFTARYVVKTVTENHNLNFLSGYSGIDKRLFDIYEYLLEYGKRFEGTLKLRSTGDDVEKQLFEQLIKYGEFQVFVEDNPDDEKLISDKSKELFGTDLVKNAQIFDMKIVKQCQMLEDYSQPIKDLFNSISFLNLRGNNSSECNQNAEQLVRIILQNVGLDKFDIPEELNLEIVEEKVADTETF